MPILQKTVSSTIHEVTQIQNSLQSSARGLLCDLSLLKCPENESHKSEHEERGFEGLAWDAVFPEHSRTF